MEEEMVKEVVEEVDKEEQDGGRIKTFRKRDKTLFE